MPEEHPNRLVGHLLVSDGNAFATQHPGPQRFVRRALSARDQYSALFCCDLSLGVGQRHLARTDERVEPSRRNSLSRLILSTALAPAPTSGATRRTPLLLARRAIAAGQAASLVFSRARAPH